MMSMPTLFPEPPIDPALIAGIDEAGRGALAGPVVAGACIITVPLFKRRATPARWSPYQRRKRGEFAIADSKALTPEEREEAYEWITANLLWGVGIAGHDIVETKGIVRATEIAMHLALSNLREKSPVSCLLIDGRDKFFFDCPYKSIIRGDQLEPCIAAGSIIAKVTRDRMMVEYAQKFTKYGFEKHKGYASEEHIAALKEHGSCGIHRTSFLSRILSTYSPTAPAVSADQSTLFDLVPA